MATTERIPLRVTPAQKALFIKKAKASKLSVNEFVRRAAEAYPSDDDVLMRLVAQVKQTTHEATAALDAAPSQERPAGPEEEPSVKSPEV